MAFVDTAKIYVKAGDGGQGCESYYRDLSMRHRRPDGGDGGKGGDIVVLADFHLHTLLDYRFQQHYKADKGGNGSSNNKTGRGGQDTILRVPVGTVLYDDDTGLLIRDLSEPQEQVIVAKGGQPGRGNIHKREVTRPELGEKRTVRFELKIIADVGLVGFPNAGKSTLICAISKVRSKIANYPFTTKEPILGIVKGDELANPNEPDGVDFVVADLPGLIEGASEGKGLGHQFLRHTERTKILVHLVDMAGTEGRDPLEDYAKINHELENYDHVLANKPRIVIANKMDEENAQENLARFKKEHDVDILEISALNKQGLDEVITQIRETLCRVNFQEKSDES